MKLNQLGAAPVLVLVAIIGVVAFLAISSSAPFKNNLLSSLFPKEESHAASNTTINGNQRSQVIDGIGVNANSLPYATSQLAPAIDLLSDTAGVKVWRVIVESHENWEITNDNSDPNSFNWTYYNQLYETPKFQGLWGLLGQLQQKNPPVIMLNVMGAVPQWMGRTQINSAQEDEFIEMVLSLLYYARNTKNLRIDIVSPYNEIDWNGIEGPQVSSTQNVRILKKMYARMDALGMGDIKFLGPDTADVGNGVNSYMPAMLADAVVMSKIDHFGLHNYGGSTGGADSRIKNSAYSNRNFWMTEYSAGCGNCDNGSPPPADWGYYSGTISQMFSYLDQGAAATFVYDAYDSFYEHHNNMGYWGMMSFNQTAKTYSPRKRFYTIAQVTKFVDPGMIRIGTTTSLSGVRFQSFLNPTTSKITIVGINDNSSQNISVTLANLPGNGNLEFYQTNSGSLNLSRGTDIPVIDGAFSVTVTGSSVFTLSGMLNGMAGSPVPSASPVNSPLPSAIPSPSPTPVPSGITIVNFDDKPGSSALSGAYGGINWGTNIWDIDAPPTGTAATNSITTHTAAQTIGTFTFQTPAVLKSVELFSNDSSDATISVACAGNSTASQTLPAGSSAVLVTNWNNTCTTVTLTSSNAWQSNFDNFAYQIPSPSPSPAASITPSPSPIPSPSTKPGDIDGNNKVDIFDYNILLTNFGKTGTNIPGDLDKTGKVDIFDYNILLTNFGK